MFHNIERELSDGEPWSFGQYSHLPPHLQLLVEKEQGRQDIWDLPNQESDSNVLIQPTNQKPDAAFKPRPI
ncbi:MAG: hypothetical protein RMY34_15360 [Aulosira sp. DedQUE10]|nr:hypothetical protein [Aulosira sp. DedQUE10]